MGTLRRGPPPQLISALRSEYDIPRFVETGTFAGDTAHWASTIFPQVVTIEFAEALYRRATERYRAAANITFLHGHTRERLKEVVAQSHAASLFWLDAHWSGDITYGEHDECPILDEIAIINNSQSDAYILIDDARFFLSPPPPPHQPEYWPNITTLLKALNSVEQRSIVVIEDVIVAVPAFAQATVQRYCQDVNAATWSQTPTSRAAPLTGAAKRVYSAVRRLLRALRGRP